MIDGIYISAAGALIQQARHDIAANNVANVNTAGFKKQLALLESRPPEALIQGLRSGDWSAGGGLFIDRTVTDFTEGVERFCEKCHICEETCQGDAIPDEKSMERGFLKYTIDPYKCLPQFAKYDGCNECVAVCPFNKKEEELEHFFIALGQ